MKTKLLLWIFVLLILCGAASAINDLAICIPFDSNADDTNGTVTVATNTAKLNTSSVVGNGSMFYDGTDDKINYSRTNVFGNDITITAWVKTAQNSSATGATIVQNSAKWALESQNGRIGTYCWGGEGWKLGGKINYDSWIHLTVILRDGVASGSVFYINGTQSGANFTCTQAASSNTMATGTLAHDLTEDFSGNIDEIHVYTKALSEAEVQADFNSGAGLSCIAAPPTTDLDLTAQDDFNSTAINSFSVNITWQNGSTTTHSTNNGTVALVNVSQTSTTINVSFWNVTNYYGTDKLNQAITVNTTNTIQASMFQAVASLNAYEKISNQSLSGVTFYIGSKSGTAFNLTAATHSVIAEKAGYYNLTSSITVPALTNTSYNILGLYSSIVNITAYYSNGTVLSNYNINITNSNYSS